MQETAPRPAIVLIVEDELLVRLFVNDVLEEAGYRTIEARDGQEALAIMEVHPDVRLLLTDAMMPNVDGYSLASIVARRWPDTRIIVTSALPPPPGALPEGVRFLPKPYKAPGLLAAVTEVLAIDAPEGAPVLPMSPVMQRPGVPHVAGGLAQPVPEPEK
jgi:CheY-like chemotaxis protein